MLSEVIAVEWAAKSHENIRLGKQGEHRAVTVVFDISEWVKEYGEGSVSLIHMRQTDPSPYPCNVTLDGNKVRWEILNTDNAIPGMGRCELRYIQENRLVKSETWATEVIRSYGVGPTPEPYQAWVDAVLAAGAKVESAVIHGPIIQEHTWWVWDFDANTYINTGVDASGDRKYVHRQLQPSSSWYISHNLGKYPAVSIVDSSGNLCVGEIVYHDENALTANFAAPFSGKAYLN